MKPIHTISLYEYSNVTDSILKGNISLESQKSLLAKTVIKDDLNQRNAIDAD